MCPERDVPIKMRGCFIGAMRTDDDDNDVAVESFIDKNP